jgi:hypothetical protein
VSSPTFDAAPLVPLLLFVRRTLLVPDQLRNNADNRWKNVNLFLIPIGFSIQYTIFTKDETQEGNKSGKESELRNFALLLFIYNIYISICRFSFRNGKNCYFFPLE